MTGTSIDLNQTKNAGLQLLLHLHGQRAMMQSMRLLISQFLLSPMATDSNEIFEREAIKFLARYPDEKSAKKVLTELLKTRLDCQSPEACDFFRNLHKPRLMLGMLHIKSRCGFFSLNKFAETFGYTYSSCFQLSLKLDIVLLEYSKKLAAIEDIDSAEFIPCWTRRSTKTPANERPHAEQAAAVAEAREAASKNSECESVIRRVDVSHLPQDMQILYQCITDKAQHSDKLLEKSGLTIGSLLSTLTMLELEELIEVSTGDSIVLKQPKSKLGQAEQKPRLVNVRHRRFAQALIPVFSLKKNGGSRRLFECQIVDIWRVLTIFATGRPVDLIDICLEANGQTLPQQRQINCPLKVRVPYVGRNLPIRLLKKL